MLFKKKDNLAEKIYQNIIEISRSKFLYTDLSLEDSFETRFDLIIYHSFIIFYFYKNKKMNKSSIPQSLFDYMFNDFENNLREMGFGDIAVNKKMKLFIKAFYGRLSQYSRGIDTFKSEGNKKLIEQTILNNIFKGSKINDEYINIFVNYMIDNINHFESKTEDENLKYSFQFKKFSNYFG